MVATGGLSIPAMGATAFGYELAREFGHAIVEPRAGLVPLVFSVEDKARWCDLAGVAFDVVARAVVQEKTRRKIPAFRERLLVTHRGVSGPAVLQASSYWRPGEEVSFDMAPGLEVFRPLLAQASGRDWNSAYTALRTVLPTRMAERWVRVRANASAGDWTNAGIARLESDLHAWTLRPDGTEGFAKAEVTVGGVEDTVALIVDGQPVTPPGMEVREVMGASEDAVLFSATTEPTEVHIYSWAAEHGLSELSPEPGVHTAAGNPRTPVIGSRTMSHDGIRWAIGDHVFASRAEQPMLTPEVRLFTLGERELRVGLVLPRGHEPGQTLPVLLDPYGGPQHQRVVASRQGWLESQWLADQGFAVIVADGRGTPGRGRAWARAVRGDLAGPVLEDQIAALTEVAALAPDLDLGRVGIRGWSFGGFLAALAVLRRPDVFHAAVAGAPVTDWRLYDTHYTERYLGVEPDGADRAAYDISSLLDEAAALRRPLLLIHGLVDDNVVAANTLRLSQRLTEAGRLHGVLPLTGITHMTPQEAVAENLLIVQVEFLRQALAQPSAG